MTQTTKITTTIPTTTLVPGITQPEGLAPLDLLARFPMQYLLLERFSPNTIVLDRYLSPLWLPFALIGCTVCTVVYAFSSFKCSERTHSTSSPTLRGTGTNLTQSVYLTSISIILIVRAVFVILIDLDTAWDTGLLACNQLLCPLTHTLSTAAKLAVALLTLTLGIESLSVVYPKSSLLFYCPVRFCVARGRYRKSVHITVALTLVSLAFGMVETAYWRVQYYLPTVLSHGSNIYQGHAPRPLARCEVTGIIHHMFTTRVDRASLDGFLDEETQQYGASTRLASSYADYKWISGITLDSIISLASISVSLAVFRAQLMTSPDRDPQSHTRSRMSQMYSAVSRHDLGHVVALNLIQGLCRLPEELFTMLEPLTRPGEVNLTDAEIELDGTWQRYFMMLTARVVCRELADLPGAFVLPVCIVFSSYFRAQFRDIFGCQFLCSRKSTSARQEHVGNRSKPANLNPYLCGCANQQRDLSCCSPKSFAPQFLHSNEQPEQSETDRSPNKWNDGSRPLWKWGQGWVMSQPTTDRSYPAQYVQMKRTQIPSGPLHHPTNRSAISGQSRFTSYGNGLDQPVQHATYHQRAASVNDILYDPRQNADCLFKSLPRVNNTAEWFEPRSYV
ncbi:hypothetical protein FGIG_04751 [Fasciola gigantica]|uniref:Uncharacterized protein n=1 Tax=Fasciola gigantica TaxID=46835 RepID=A0A504YZU5_FASGI|nr:hypothetical protein FGIG_04751 [Fasciola gigantica]